MSSLQGPRADADVVDDALALGAEYFASPSEPLRAGVVAIVGALVVVVVGVSIVGPRYSGVAWVVVCVGIVSTGSWRLCML